MMTAIFAWTNEVPDGDIVSVEIAVPNPLSRWTIEMNSTGKTTVLGLEHRGQRLEAHRPMPVVAWSEAQRPREVVEERHDTQLVEEGHRAVELGLKQGNPAMMMAGMLSIVEGRARRFTTVNLPPIPERPTLTSAAPLIIRLRQDGPAVITVTLRGNTLR